MLESTTVREVKQCFVLSDKAKKFANLNITEFQEGLGAFKKDVEEMSEQQLDSVLDWRAPEYNRLTWRWGTVSIDEIGVWPGAAGLPERLCLGSVRETASGILKMGGVQALPVNGDTRARDSIPGMEAVAEVISNERLLSLIARAGGTYRKPPHERMRWDLDDGSVRSVALALVGIERLNAFFGT